MVVDQEWTKRLQGVDLYVCANGYMVRDVRIGKDQVVDDTYVFRTLDEVKEWLEKALVKPKQLTDYP